MIRSWRNMMTKTNKTLRPYYSKGGVDLYHSDCLKTLPRLPAESVDLVFADPPFNIEYDYDIYKDNKNQREYLSWTWDWIRACKRLMRQTASIYIAIGAGMQAEVKQIMGNAGLIWRNTIIWHYTFGPRQESNWTPSWVAIHYATVSDAYTWNTQEVRVPSARQ